MDDSDDEVDEAIAMLAKNYNRVMRWFNQMAGKNVPQDVRDNRPRKSQTIVDDNREGRRGQQERDQSVQCFECKGYGHVQRECPNFLKQKKGYIASFSDTIATARQRTPATLSLLLPLKKP